MNILSRGGRATVVAALATLLLAASGTVTQASAATTYWTFKSRYNGHCLTGSASTTAVWTAPCTGGPSQQWYWYGTREVYGGESYRMLRNRHSGDCLMTDFESGGGRNAVWQSSCSNQTSTREWTNDSPDLLQPPYVNNSLRVSPASNAVYTNDPLFSHSNDIPYLAHTWSRSHT